MKNIKHKIIVLSGKGGVGKSSIAINLAVWLSTQGKKTGLLDVDIHGPSVPKMLGLENNSLVGDNENIEPVEYSENLKVMSVGFLLKDDSDALIWRGPMKHNIISQFVKNVSWGNLDYLVVDCPPGTGDEPLSIIQLVENADGAVIVTTPQELAVVDVKKCITFCRKMNLEVLGVIENMSGFVCPHCNKRTDIFKGDGGRILASDFGIPFLGAIPIDAKMALSGDNGKPLVSFEVDNPTAQAINYAFQPLLNNNKNNATENNKEKNIMKIAIPLTQSKLSLHFGHCEQFAIIEVDQKSKEVKNTKLLTPPAHEPGLLPKWLSEMNVNLIIAGGMGQRAQQLFAENNIEVLCGAEELELEELVNKYMHGNLELGSNVCDH